MRFRRDFIYENDPLGMPFIRNGKNSLEIFHGEMRLEYLGFEGTSEVSDHCVAPHPHEGVFVQLNARKPAPPRP
jgi:hypothetical protein